MKRVLILAIIPALFLGCGVSPQVKEEKSDELKVLKSELRSLKSERNELAREKEKLLDDIVGANERIKMLKKDDKESTTVLKIKESQLNKAEDEIEALARELEELRQEHERPSGELASAKEEIARLEASLAEAKEELTTLSASAANKGASTEREEAAEALRLNLAAAIGDSAPVKRDGDEVTVTIPGDVIFDALSVDVLPSGSAILKSVAEAVKDSGELIRVVGHTDDIPVGPSHRVYWRSNWELSSERAGAIVRYLQWGPGIKPERMEAVGRAHYDPAVKGRDEKSRARNRRVELVIIQPPASP